MAGPTERDHHGGSKLSIGKRVAHYYDEELIGSPNPELLAATIDAAIKPLFDLAKKVSVNALSELRAPRAELVEMADAILADIDQQEKAP